MLALWGDVRCRIPRLPFLPKASMSADRPALTIVESESLSDFDRRGLPGNLRFAANLIDRHEPKEEWVARTLRLLADELEESA